MAPVVSGFERRTLQPKLLPQCQAIELSHLESAPRMHSNYSGRPVASSTISVTVLGAVSRRRRPAPCSTAGFRSIKSRRRCAALKARYAPGRSAETFRDSLSCRDVRRGADRMLPRPRRPRVVAVCLRRVSDGASGSGEVAPLPHRRPGRAQQTGAGRARPSRFAVAFGEPGPPDAAPLPLRVDDGIREGH
jgi:hypothetical protein